MRCTELASATGEVEMRISLEACCSGMYMADSDGLTNGGISTPIILQGFLILALQVCVLQSEVFSTLSRQTKKSKRNQ